MSHLRPVDTLRRAALLVAWFILRYLVWYPGRAVPGLLGIAVGVAVIAAIRLANVSVLEAFRAATDSISGTADLRIYGTNGPIDESQLAELLWLEQWGEISPVLETYAMLVEEPEPQERGASSGFGRGELLLVLGSDVLRDQSVRRYEVWKWGKGEASALTPRQILDLLLARDSIILTERFAQRKGIRIGDRIALAFGSRVRHLRVQALLRDTGPARTLQGNFALMDLAALQWAANRLGVVDALDIKLPDSATLEQAWAAIEEKLPPGLRVEPPTTRAGRSETMVRAFQFNLAALSGVALVVGLFLIYSTVSFSVTSRREEIAILLALGTSRLGVTGLFLSEAVVLATIGILWGLPLGQVLARGAVAAAASTVENFYVAGVAEATSQQTSLSWDEWLLCAALAWASAISASVLPAWRAAGLEPLEILRGLVPATQRDRVLRVVGQSLVLALLGAAAQACPPVDGRPVFGFLAALCWASAVARTTPLWFILLAKMGILHKGVPLTVRLALAGLRSGGGLLGASVAALGFSLGMMFAIAIMVGSFRTTVIYWLDGVLTSDLVVKPAMNSPTLSTATLDPELVEKLRTQPEIAASTWYSSRQIPYGQSMIRLDTSELAVLLEHGRILFKEPAAPQRAILDALAEGQPFAIVSESYSLRYHKRPGDMVTLESRSGPIQLPILAVYYDYSSNLGSILIDYQFYSRYFLDSHPYYSPMALSFYLRPGVDVQQVRNRWQKLFQGEHALYFITQQELRAEALRIFDSTFAITYALQWIAVIVAGTGIVSSLMRLIYLRRPEIALLSLAGVTPMGIHAIILCQSLIISVISLALGWIIGILLSLVLIYVINVQSFGWTIQFYLPWDFFIQSVFIVLITALLFGWIPARHAATMDALAAVRQE